MGKGGFVTILIPAGNVSALSHLPPACPGFSTKDTLHEAYAAGLNVVARLEPQYSVTHGQCFKAIGPLRDLSDDSNHTSYKTVAATYAKVAQSLPRPIDGSPLYVQIGNELNLAWDCSCTAATPCMPMAQVAFEAAHYLHDCLAALQSVPGIKIGISPIAPIGLQSRSCCDHTTCPGSKDASFTNLAFIQLMLAAVPDLYDEVDWLSSHSYPCSMPGCGLSDGAHSPAEPCDGWNAPFEQVPMHSLRVAYSLSRLVSG